MSDYDQLAAGTVAGHIIECGTQCTGGNFTHWREAGDLTNIGYPVVEANADGSFVVTKHPGTGGAVTTDTVTAQLLYELGDPNRYLTPDCVADFTTIELERRRRRPRAGQGVKGAAPTDTLKVSIAIEGGFKAQGELTVGGPDAIEKANFTAELLFKRLELDGVTLRAARAPRRTRRQQRALQGHDGRPGRPERSRACASACAATTSASSTAGAWNWRRCSPAGPPGLTGFAGGRPKATEIVAYWPALIARDAVAWSTNVETVRDSASVGDIAMARSGDKGADANVGVWARTDADYEVFAPALTAEVVKAHFADMCHGDVAAVRAAEAARAQLHPARRPRRRRQRQPAHRRAGQDLRQRPAAAGDPDAR